MSAADKLGAGLRVVPPTVWLIAAGGLAAWLLYRKAAGDVVDVIDHISEAVGDAPQQLHNVVTKAPAGVVSNAVPGVLPGVWLYDHAGQAIEWVNEARDTISGWFGDRALQDKLAGHSTDGFTWYGYDRNKAAKDAKAAANSQIAKDVQKYGGSYGGLLH